jgi:hypothetical protein
MPKRFQAISIFFPMEQPRGRRADVSLSGRRDVPGANASRVFFLVVALYLWGPVLLIRHNIDIAWHRGERPRLVDEAGVRT